MFASENSLDPALSSFTTDGYYGGFYMVKKTTSVWELYGTYNETYGMAALHRITGIGTNDFVTVEVNMTNAGTTAPGGTAVGYGFAASYANRIPWQVKPYTCGYASLAAGASMTFKATDFSAQTPSGYSPVAICRATTGSDKVNIVSFDANATGNETMLHIKNNGTAAVTDVAAVEILYIRT